MSVIHEFRIELTVVDLEFSVSFGKFLEFARILAVLDLKVVGNEMKCFNEKEIAAILHLAKSKLSEVESVEQLEWD